MRYDKLFVKLQESFRMIEEQGSNEELLKTPGTVFINHDKNEKQAEEPEFYRRKSIYFIVTNVGKPNDYLVKQISRRVDDNDILEGQLGASYLINNRLEVINPNEIEDEEVKHNVIKLSNKYLGKPSEDRDETPSQKAVYPRGHGLGGSVID